MSRYFYVEMQRPIYSPSSVRAGRLPGPRAPQAAGAAGSEPPPAPGAHLREAGGAFGERVGGRWWGGRGLERGTREFGSRNFCFDFFAAILILFLF